MRVRGEAWLRRGVTQPRGRARVCSNRRVRLGNRRRSERRGRRRPVIGFPQRCMRRVYVRYRFYVSCFLFYIHSFVHASPLSPSPVEDTVRSYVRRDRNPGSPALQYLQYTLVLHRALLRPSLHECPRAHKRARASRDTMGPKTLISTDLNVDAIATSGSLVAAGASQLTGRLWSGAVLVCAFAIPRFPNRSPSPALPSPPETMV